MMQPSIKPADEHSAGDIIARIGSLTRMLRDSLRELGLDQAIAEAAEAIPDARDRLYYVVQMTAQAAERALNSVEASQPHQDQMEKSAKALTQRWDDWFADPIDLADARELVTDTRQFLADVPAHTSFTNAQLLEIMMAQDFQDLTGQVIKRMMDVIQIVTAEKQPGFTLANCVCTVDAEALVSGKHVFFSNGLWKSRGREDGYAYDTRMAVAGSYLADYKSP